MNTTVCKLETNNNRFDVVLNIKQINVAGIGTITSTITTTVFIVTIYSFSVLSTCYCSHYTLLSICDIIATMKIKGLHHICFFEILLFWHKE